jgi:hypothetical protein
MLGYGLIRGSGHLSLWLLAVLVAGPPSDTAFDSDLTVVCGEDFAVFDRFEPNGRILNVVPWVAEGELAVAGSTEMPGSQPHQWAIQQEYVVVRTWNELYIYRVGADFHPQLLDSSQIDEDRSSVGGTVALDVSGSSVRAYGVERMIALDLDSCAQQCEMTVHAAPARPPARAPTTPCEVHKEDRLFALTVAETPGSGAIYHDLFLTRRRTDSAGQPIVERFEPESILFLGTRIETGFH